MAKIIFSGLVTAIVGSIQGTTFKRTRYGYSVGKKSVGYSKNISLKNNGLGVMRAVRFMWSNLATDKKETWDAMALVTPFNDKFSNPIFLTGRLLFIKTQCPLYEVGGNYEDGSTFTKLMNATAVTFLDCDLATNKFRFDVDYTGAPAYFFYSLELGVKAKRLPVFNRRKIMFRSEFSAPQTINLYDVLIENFPFAEVGDNYRLYVTPCNSSGYQLQPLYVDGILT